MLPAGSVFDLTSRTLAPREAEVSSEDAEELAEAQRDVLQMARGIAAADKSPGALKRRLARNKKRAEKVAAKRAAASDVPTEDQEVTR